MTKFNEMKEYTGTAVALAWPKTYCRQAGGWYDGLMTLLGICRHHHYRVGHAAVILADQNTGKCHYYDFGRYEAPYGYGRVRSEVTDPRLKVHTRAQFCNHSHSIKNLTEILEELQKNASCHGEGIGFAAECPVNFRKARAKALRMQQHSPIAYGPFVRKGTNCSRFVNTVVKAGRPPLRNLLRLKYFIWFTPSPMNNIHALNNKIRLPHLRDDCLFCPGPIKDKSLLKTTLPEPKRPNFLPSHAQWLSGEGAGSWYAVDPTNENRFQLRRFGLGGKPEGKAIMESSKSTGPDLGKPYQIVHLSNCQQLRIVQKGEYYTLRCIEKPAMFGLRGNATKTESKTMVNVG